MLDVLMGKNGFPGYAPFSTTVETAEYGKPPKDWVGQLPSLHCYFDHMAGEDWTQNRPMDIARYIFEIRARSVEFGELATPAEQFVSNAADVLVEVLRLNSTVQLITPYVHREEVVMDYEERENYQVPVARVHIRAELKSRGGIWGYSTWGQFVWG